MKENDAVLFDVVSLSPKWKDNLFIQEQLLKHLEEVTMLIQDNQEHQYAEIIDLINIADCYLRNNLQEEELEQLKIKRYNKFKKKANDD